MSITITTFGRVKKIPKGRGTSYVSGKLVLSTTSTFPTSGIEKLFRRCNDISLNNVSQYNLQFNRSTAHKNGIIKAKSGAATAALATTLSTTFTAFGF